MSHRAKKGVFKSPAEDQKVLLVKGESSGAGWTLWCLRWHCAAGVCWGTLGTKCHMSPGHWVKQYAPPLLSVNKCMPGGGGWGEGGWGASIYKKAFLMWRDDYDSYYLSFNWQIFPHTKVVLQLTVQPIIWLLYSLTLLKKLVSPPSPLESVSGLLYRGLLPWHRKQHSRWTKLLLSERKPFSLFTLSFSVFVCHPAESFYMQNWKARVFPQGPSNENDPDRLAPFLP